MQTRPKPKRRDVAVLDEGEIATLLAHLRGHWLYMPVLMAISTGARRGKVIAAQWSNLDIAKGTWQVSRSVQELGGKFHFTVPKTARSRRVIQLPASLIEALGQHRKEQATTRLRLGLGRDADDLIFTMPDGAMMRPNTFTEAFAYEVRRAGLKPTRLHALRHSHLAQLLRAGVPVHAVAARAGHARPSTTLNCYSHLLGGEDGHAAAVADDILRRALK